MHLPLRYLLRVGYVFPPLCSRIVYSFESIAIIIAINKAMRNNSNANNYANDIKKDHEDIDDYDN